MNNFLLIFDGMVEDNVKPILTDIQLGNRIILNNLQDKRIGPYKNSLERIILRFQLLKNFLQDLEPHQLHNLEQFLADLQIFGNELLLLVRERVRFHFGDVAIFYEGD